MLIFGNIHCVRGSDDRNTKERIMLECSWDGRVFQAISIKWYVIRLSARCVTTKHMTTCISIFPEQCIFKSTLYTPILSGGGFTSNRGTFGNVSKLDTMMCVSYGKTPDVCYTGGGNGSIYIWVGQTLKKAVKAHEGPCFAMHSLDKVHNVKILRSCFLFGILIIRSLQKKTNDCFFLRLNNFQY